MLPREHRLRSAREIREVVSRGRKIGGSFATLHFQPAAENQFAIIVSKAVGNAVVRNLVKRRMRAILRSEIESSAKIMGAFRMRPNAAVAPYAELKLDVQKLLERAR